MHGAACMGCPVDASLVPERGSLNINLGNAVQVRTGPLASPQDVTYEVLTLVRPERPDVRRSVPLHAACVVITWSVLVLMTLAATCVHMEHAP